MKKIPLSNSRRVALVDNRDYDLVCQLNWRMVPGRNKIKYAEACFCSKNVRMHQWILWNAKMVDHRDGNGLNNRRKNIRVCTNSQNQANRRKSRFNGTEFKGVCPPWHRHPGWGAVIICNGKKHWLGTFKSEKEAALAYDRASIRLFGQFARVNFPKSKGQA